MCLLHMITPRICRFIGPSQIASQQYPFPQLAKDAQVIAWVCVGNIPEWPDTSDPDLNEVGYFVTSAWDGNPERRPNMKALRDSLAL